MCSSVWPHNPDGGGRGARATLVTIKQNANHPTMVENGRPRADGQRSVAWHSWMVFALCIIATVVLLVAFDALLSVAKAVTGAPEGLLENLALASWILLLVGASCLGAVLRRRKPVIAAALRRGAGAVAGLLIILWVLVWLVHMSVADALLRHDQDRRTVPGDSPAVPQGSPARSASGDAGASSVRR